MVGAQSLMPVFILKNIIILFYQIVNFQYHLYRWTRENYVAKKVYSLCVCDNVLAKYY